MVSCWNRESTAFELKPMERLATLVIVPVLTPPFDLVEAFKATERAGAGFGSSGSH
jgi:dUTP pyrophosphatase